MQKNGLSCFVPTSAASRLKQLRSLQAMLWRVTATAVKRSYSTLEKPTVITFWCRFGYHSLKPKRIWTKCGIWVPDYSPSIHPSIHPSSLFQFHTFLFSVFHSGILHINNWGKTLQGFRQNVPKMTENALFLSPMQRVLLATCLAEALLLALERAMRENGLFERIGRMVSEEVILELIKTKCLAVWSRSLSFK